MRDCFNSTVIWDDGVCFLDGFTKSPLHTAYCILGHYGVPYSRLAFENRYSTHENTTIEEPCSKLQGMFCLAAVLRGDRKEGCHFIIRSLTPQQATGLARAMAVHHWRLTKTCRPFTAFSPLIFSGPEAWLF
jgi:hypothetical protein